MQPVLLHEILEIGSEVNSRDNLIAAVENTARFGEEDNLVRF